MKTRRLISPLSILLALSLFLSAPVWADSTVRIVRLSLVDGPVQLDRATGEGFERAIMNMPIAHGMQLWTRGDSHAEIEFEEGNTIRVAPDSKVEFSQLILRENGSRFTVVRIDHGRVYVNFSRTNGEDFRIQVGNREVFLDHSAHFRVDLVNDRAEVAVFGGELNLERDLRVKKNNSAILDLNSGRGFEFAKGIAPALEDRWDDYRSDYHDKYAKSAYKGAPFYGRSDLNYYGGWISSSFGSCWRPYGFDASWSPYSAGAWAWYPGYGYTFVSLYPWGWQPFRSGAWNFAGGTGWCWSPGFSRGYYGYGYAPMYNGTTNVVIVQPPVHPPTYVGGPGGRGRLPLIPVGDVDTNNWRPKRDSRDGWQRDPDHHRGSGGGRVLTGGGVSTGGSSSGSANASTATTSSDPARTLDRPSRGRDYVAPDRSAGYGRSSEASVDGPARIERTPRDMQRDVQREQQQVRREQRDQGQFQREQREQRQMQREQQRDIQREQRGSDRGFERQSAPSHSSAPSNPAPQMNAPAPPPAPVQSAPPASAPARGDRGRVPK